MLESPVQVVGVGVHDVMVPGLVASAVATSVVGNYSATIVGHEDQPVGPVVPAEGPAVRKDDGGRAGVVPVFVVHAAAIFEGDRRHLDSVRLTV